MKYLLTTVLTLLLSISTWGANIKSGSQYKIVCRQFTQGCVTDGATAGQPTPLYYLPQANNNTENYWILTVENEEEGFYSIRNAKTNQYITYDGVREDASQTGMTRRYISMTDEMETESFYSLWRIIPQGDGIYAIRCAGSYLQAWDVRVDSYVVGTYSKNEGASFANNQLFMFYDRDGKQVNDNPEEEETGINVSSWFKDNTESMDGWNATGGWFQNTGAGGSHYNYNDGATLVQPFVETWQESAYGPLSDCSLTQILRALPAGNYTLQADMMAVRQAYSNHWGSQENEPATGVVLFANQSYVNVATGNDPPQRFKLDFTLSTQGDVELGVRVTNTNANWIAIDNVVLYFNGTNDELLQGEIDKVKAELSDYYSDAEIEQMIADCNGDFYQLEQLRKSTEFLPAIDPLSRALQQLTFDGHAPIYVESLDLYLCSIPLDNFGRDYTATISYTPKEGSTNLRINNREIAAGSQYTFTNVSANKTYTLETSKADNTVIRKYVTFTSLPVVRLYGSFSNEYSEGSISVDEPDKAAAQMLSMKAKWRGGITNGNGKHKRNYHVKLKDANGDKLEQKFFGLRNDNSWILESCQVDMSRIRNRVLTDLWNDYSTPPYYINKEPKAMTGSRGNFVELVLNGEYRGIYCMTENVDRKQMKLKKYDETTGETHGMLWKSKEWSYATMMGTRPDGGYYPKDYLSDPSEYSESWDQYYVKYPDIDDVTTTQWSPLYSTVNFVCTADDNIFRHYISSYIDLPLFIDYYILMETILASDNHGKNMFFAIYDTKTSNKLTFAVWDMDATCGQRWSDQYYHDNYLMSPERDYSEYISTEEHGDYNLFKRLRDTDADNFNMRVRMRYRDLRANHLATESILQRFRTYLDEFKACGAAQREYNKWNGDSDIAGHSLDFDNEMEYITDWFTRRMNYLDTQRFDIASLPTDIDVLQNADARNQKVYSLSGMLMGTMEQWDDMPAGVYLVGGKKVVKE